jgi:lysozyme
LFEQDVRTAENAVERSVKVPLSQNQYDALVSLAYNIGGGSFATSTLVQELNSGNNSEAADQFLAWDKITNKRTGNREPDKGLTRRRNDERSLFLYGAYG